MEQDCPDNEGIDNEICQACETLYHCSTKWPIPGKIKETPPQAVEGSILKNLKDGMDVLFKATEGREEGREWGNKAHKGRCDDE